MSSHLESADSVRTNPRNPFYQTQFNRLFAEAYVNLLLGQRLQFGQVPLFDSHGLVQFLAELFRVMGPLQKERKGQLGGRSPFLPLVLTHYPKTGDGTPLTDPKNVLAQSLISGLRDANFIHSALPIFDKRTDQALCESLASEIQTADSGIRVGALTPTLQKRLEQNPVDLRHLRNLEEIDRYCRSNATFTVRRNSVGLNVKLGHCLDAMLKFGNAPKNLAFVSDFYADVVNANDIDKLNRSIVYDAAEKKFGFTDRRAIVIEMADSLYMWNQGRLAGAHSETTS
ncbi:MAG: hypothetical protein AAFN70_12315, partial [Planctomycetota bacterium]